MNTLRAKIATLVVAAVLIVIGLAVWLFWVLVPMAPPSFERLVEIDCVEARTDGNTRLYCCLLYTSDAADE